MKTIGLIGGMSWESTLPYYSHINTLVRERLGGLHSARVVLNSVDFEEVAALQRADDWDAAATLLVAAARAVEAAGAGCVLVCTNTMHKVAPQIQAAVDIPLLHIGDALGVAVRKVGLQRLGLLGTRFTMEQAFYRDYLREMHALEVLVPAEAERALVHRVIFDELCVGRAEPASRAAYRNIMAGLAAAGAQGIILGCTEISLLVDGSDAPVPLFDTTALHARMAVDWALGG